MKTLLLLIILTFSLHGFSQATDIHISAAQLKQVKSVRDLVTGIPADCKINGCVFVIAIKGSYKEFTIVTSKDGNFTKDMTAMFSNCQKGQSFSLERFNASCAAFFRSKSYHFIVD